MSLLKEHRELLLKEIEQLNTAILNEDLIAFTIKEDFEKEGYKLIQERLEKIKKDIKECEQLADKYGCSFSSPISVYGMGGHYYPKTKKEKPEDADDWESSDENENEGWVSSSAGC